jgi:hypothetical protein
MVKISFIPIKTIKLKKIETHGCHVSLMIQYILDTCQEDLCKEKMMTWAFARINKRLAEIYFEGQKIIGHCYVRRKEYHSKQEILWIANDTQKYRFAYKNGRYLSNL